MLVFAIAWSSHFEPVPIKPIFTSPVANTLTANTAGISTLYVTLTAGTLNSTPFYRECSTLTMIGLTST